MKANTLSLVSKSLAALMVFSAAIVSLCGGMVDMSQVITAASFIAASFIPVDISKIKSSTAAKEDV